MTNEFKVSNNVVAKTSMVERILANREENSSSTVGMLLAGDPGTGKTSFVRFLAHLLGMQLIVIEAPHITEEHIINIPFIVFNDDNSPGVKGEQKVEEHGPTIELADSYLFSQLNRAKGIDDSTLLKNIYKGHDQYQHVWEELGGDETTIPEPVAEFRAHTKVMLFIDEFFRNPSNRIKNILRGILNGKLGTHSLPQNAYVIYASNLKDEGVTDIPKNTDFVKIKLEVPDKDEWFSWLVNKYKDSEEVHLNMDIINAFYKLLKQEHLSSHDLEANVRASPRSWEQILLYINSSLPAENEKDAKSLISNIRSKFSNYQTGEEHTIAAGVLDVVSKLIKETSDFEVGTAGNTEEEWRSTFEHQIKQKMKLGNARTYVPIVSGPPGIGKTSEMALTALNLDLRYIYVDCSTLDPEMTLGIPLPDNPKGSKTRAVRFSFPQLYTQIMNDIAKEDAAHIKNMSSAEKKAYSKKKYKYMIFFDEFNRTSVKVFNGLRRVLLEKDFGPGLELPDEAIMVAAINPTDVGTQELTMHMRDVVDIIDSQPSWKLALGFIDKLKVKALPVALETAKNTVIKMMLNFKETDPKRSADQRPFYMGMGETPLYVSPREIVTMIRNTARVLSLKLNNKRLKAMIETDDVEQRKQAFDALALATFTTIDGVLSIGMDKQGIDAPEFLHDLENWIHEHLDVAGIFVKKNKTLGLESIIDPYFGDSKKDMTKELELINYVEGNDIQVFKDELSQYLVEKLKNDKTHLTNKKHHIRGIADGKLTKDENVLVSNLEHLVRDIILAFKVNKVSSEMFDGVKFATRDALKELIRVLKEADEGDLTDEALELNGRLLRLFKA